MTIDNLANSLIRHDHGLKCDIRAYAFWFDESPKQILGFGSQKQ